MRRLLPIFILATSLPFSGLAQKPTVVRYSANTFHSTWAARQLHPTGAFCQCDSQIPAHRRAAIWSSASEIHAAQATGMPTRSVNTKVEAAHFIANTARTRWPSMCIPWRRWVCTTCGSTSYPMASSSTKLAWCWSRYFQLRYKELQTKRLSTLTKGDMKHRAIQYRL